MTKSTQAQAAAAIRKQLKAHKIPASVTSSSASMCTAVRVSLTDCLPAVFDQVNDFAQDYAYGGFDAMQDLQTIKKDNGLPRAKYVEVTRKFSPAMEQAAWEWIRANYQGADELAADYSEITYQDLVRGEYANSMVRGVLCGTIASPVWVNHKQRQAVAEWEAELAAQSASNVVPFPKAAAAQ